MRGRVPIKVPKLSEQFHRQAMKKTAQPENQPSEQGNYLAGGGNVPMDPNTGAPMPLPTTVDRTQEINEMIRNFRNVARMAESHADMWQRVLDSGGEDVDSFVDNPQEWDEKRWTKAVRDTGRLLRDTNDALMRIVDVEGSDMSEEGGPEGEGGNEADDAVELVEEEGAA